MFVTIPGNAGANKIDRHGAQSIAQMQQLRILNIGTQEVNSAYNNIGDAGSVILAESLPNLLTLSMGRSLLK